MHEALFLSWHFSDWPVTESVSKECCVINLFLVVWEWIHSRNKWEERISMRPLRNTVNVSIEIAHMFHRDEVYFHTSHYAERSVHCNISRNRTSFRTDNDTTCYTIEMNVNDRKARVFVRFRIANAIDSMTCSTGWHRWSSATNTISAICSLVNKQMTYKVDTHALWLVCDLFVSKSSICSMHSLEVDETIRLRARQTPNDRYIQVYIAFAPELARNQFIGKFKIKMN